MKSFRASCVKASKEKKNILNFFMKSCVYRYTFPVSRVVQFNYVSGIFVIMCSAIFFSPLLVVDFVLFVFNLFSLLLSNGATRCMHVWMMRERECFSFSWLTTLWNPLYVSVIRFLNKLHRTTHDVMNAGKIPSLMNSDWNSPVENCC